MGTVGITSRCLRTLQRYGSRLETLELSNVDIFVDKRTGTTAFPDLALQTFTRLESLTLQPLESFSFVPEPLQDQETLFSLANTLTRLVVGGLDFSLYSSNDCLQHLSALTKLQELTLRATFDEEITTVLKVSEQLTRLTSLRHIDLQTLSEEICDDDDGHALLLCCRYLPMLRSFGPHVMFTSSQSSIFCSPVPLLSSLQSLNVSFSNTNLETEPIDRFLQSLSFIEKLAIYDTELRAQHVATICSLPALRFLSLHSCHIHTLSSVDYTSAFSRATGLVALEMLHCEQQQAHLTDDSLEQILSSLTRLERLSILCDTIPLHSIRLPSLPMLRTVTISSDTLKELSLDQVSSLHSLSVGSKQGVAIHSLEAQQHLREIYLRTAKPADCPILFPPSLSVLHLHASFDAEPTDLSNSILRASKLHSLAIMSSRFEDSDWQQIVQRLSGLRLLMLPINTRVSETHGLLSITALTDLRKLDLVLSPGAHKLHESTISRLKRALKKCHITHRYSEQAL